MKHSFLKKMYSNYCASAYLSSLPPHKGTPFVNPVAIESYEWVVKHLYGIMPFGQKLPVLNLSGKNLYLPDKTIPDGDVSVGYFSIENNAFFMSQYKFIQQLALPSEYFLLSEQQRILQLLYFMSMHVFNTGKPSENLFMLNSSSLSDVMFQSHYDNPVLRYSFYDVYKNLEHKHTSRRIFNTTPLIVAIPFMIIERNGDILRGTNIKIKLPTDHYISIFLMKKEDDSYYYQIKTHSGELTDSCNDHIRGRIYQHSHLFRVMKKTKDLSVIINNISMFFIKQMWPDYSGNKPFSVSDKLVYDMCYY